jgi:hypothetical protein
MTADFAFFAAAIKYSTVKRMQKGNISKRMAALTGREDSLRRFTLS